MMGRLGQWNKCIEQVINESYEILVSTVCVKSIKGNSPVMVKNMIIDRVPICMSIHAGWGVEARRRGRDTKIKDQGQVITKWDRRGKITHNCGVTEY